MARKLAQSDEVRECLAEQMERYALSRGLSGNDTCSHDAIYAAFAASDYNLRDLMVAVTTSDAFRHLAKESE